LEKPKKDKRKDSFWRACRYLWPHSKLVIISILCAFVVGGAFTTGLGTMLPIMQVLIDGGTVQDWVNRKVVEDRLNVRLADDNHEVRVAAVKTGDNPLHLSDTLWLPNDVRGPASSSHALVVLSDPSRSTAAIVIGQGPPTELSLARIPFHLRVIRSLSAALPAKPLPAIAVVLGFLLALSLFGNTVRFFQEYYSEKASILAVRDIRTRMYDHTLHLGLSFFGTHGTSDITSRLTGDAQGLQDGLKNIVGDSVQETIKAVMALGLALFLSWQLTAFIIVFGPIMFMVIKKFGKKVRRAARAALQNSSSMLGQIEGSLYGIRVVKSTTAERFERRRFRSILGNLVREQARIAKLEAFNTPMLEMMTLVVVCCIVLYASNLVLVTKTLTTSRFFLVMACLMGIGESLRKVSKINTLLQKSNAAAARLFEVIDLPAERNRQEQRSKDKGPRTILKGIEREVHFDDITFTYPGASTPALSHVSLTVEKGKSIAIVGRNGSGKTTLLALLPRFFDPTSGRITIDGTDIRQFTLPSLRRQIGIVTQDSVIFPGTLADNIAYANPRAKREDIEAAAKRAFAHDFILEKPSGYDTIIGEHGAQLSGGQKQRLCIARAILRQTPILILDEATSQVDAESEHLIQQAIESLMHERTTFVIAHRFSTILSADSIVVMDRGEIVGTGSHKELLANCPTYKQLYERQILDPGETGL
jgi:subfamily B ATP-binding cassette protein MsbA